MILPLGAIAKLPPTLFATSTTSVSRSDPAIDQVNDLEPRYSAKSTASQLAPLAPSNQPQLIDQQICAANLEAQIQKIIDDPALARSRVGVYAVALNNDPNDELLVDIDGDRLFLPASNTKLFTTAAALQRLGTNFKFQTSLASRLTPDRSGRLRAPLIVISSGDPSLSPQQIEDLVTQLKDAGVNAINNLEIQNPRQDNSNYFGYGWEWQDLPEYYGAEPHPLTVHENVLDWTIAPTQSGKAVEFTWADPLLAAGWVVRNYAATSKVDGEYTLTVQRVGFNKELILRGKMPANATPELGAIAVPDPRQHFLKLLQAELRRQGIELPGLVDISNQLPPGITQSMIVPTPGIIGDVSNLATVSSPPLADLVKKINKDSNNLYAELVLQALARRSRDRKIPQETADQIYTQAIEQVTQFLDSLGITPDSYAIADGSGLSRHNLIAPEAIVTLLEKMQNDQAFRDSLPIAAVDGTIRNRFKDTIAANNLSAKTGTLSGVVTLSGYVTTVGGDEVAFSIMINNGNQPTWQLRGYVDQIALLLANLGDC
ncbi:D-alanyl-D-alanine carboxypeptidase/D-alanyl-D-alanine endopeptidase [Thalassoporum mexicanum]|uniref:D-alanyl-D-alanine carboxypeptidase/D-alanyl-D-alanine endopeptidase n=1 Tax=Thalassoporum mexicanum TaxID=3457544 RepID=UPI0018DBF796|nr:D-alanyl-D-alanine carboxypeptidase/D-alanyl-D-alanine-endopeptidase [Pseudanabaena sp. PCC 7367]